MCEIYFDNSATTPVHPMVLEEMLPYFDKEFGNPSSTHRCGEKASKAVEKARESVAAMINAGADEIYFTSGGTEANNLALYGTAYAHWQKGQHIITTSIEHGAVLEPCRFLEEQGFKVTYLPVDESGLISPDQVLQAITPDTIMISVMLANNEIGTIQPVEEVGHIAREKGILFHCDAVQAAGKIPINVEQINCDLLSISAHKMYGPKGIGCLYVRRGTRILPIIRGGGQEKGLRAGTENVPAIVGFGRACELAVQEMKAKSWELVFLRDRIIDGVLERIPGSYLNGHRCKRLPGHASFCFDNIESKDMIHMLNEKGIAVSSGAACHAESPKPSHVLKAMGYSDELALSALRVSLGRDNNDEEVDYFLAILPDIISLLRDVKPGLHTVHRDEPRNQMPERMD